MHKVQSIATRCLLLVTLLAVLGLAACGPTPAPTPMPSDTPLPTPTLRPTYTPTVLAQVTQEPSPTVVATKEQALPTSTQAPTSQATRTPEPTPTPPEFTPTPAATRAAGPPPILSGSLLLPVFDTSKQTYDINRLDLATGKMVTFIEQGSQPAITPDGQRVGWRSWKPEQRGLLSRPLDSTDIWQMISFNEAARPDWSPDGQQFVFASQQEPDRVSRIYLFTGTGGDEQFIEIQRNGSPIIGRVPAFLPDSRIVYQGCVEDECGLLLMDDNGTNPRFLENTFPDDTTPAVSPGGQQIAYMSKSSGYWQVKVVNVDGSGQRPLTDDWYWNGLPVWSPDGKYIIFVSTRDDNWPNTFSLVDNAGSKLRLWIMDADGSNQRLLNDFAFRLDGVPAGVPAAEVNGWIEERLVWMASSATD